MTTYNKAYRRITVYRDDSTTPVVYEPVKHYWYEANNTVLVIAYITHADTGAHNYVHWPVSRFQWFRDEKLEQQVPEKYRVIESRRLE